MNNIFSEILRRANNPTEKELKEFKDKMKRYSKRKKEKNK